MQYTGGEVEREKKRRTKRRRGGIDKDEEAEESSISPSSGQECWWHWAGSTSSKWSVTSGAKEMSVEGDIMRQRKRRYYGSYLLELKRKIRKFMQ